jgi:hypothetical protein
MHWQQGRGPEERNSGGFGIAYIRPRPPLTDSPTRAEFQVNKQKHTPCEITNTHEATEPSTSTRCQQKENPAEETNLKPRDTHRERATTRLP